MYYKDTLNYLFVVPLEWFHITDQVYNLKLLTDDGVQL